MIIIAAMIFLGLVLGFVGGGGAGLVLAVLTGIFGIPIHTALGTSLGAMLFTTSSGVVSHFREHNLAVKEGVVVGVFGAIGAYGGVWIASLIPPREMTYLTAGALYLSALLILLRIFFPLKWSLHGQGLGMENKARFWAVSGGVGLSCGLLSGTFGIGAAPFIQLGLMAGFSLSLAQIAGTTMLVILPIALSGGAGYLAAGYLDPMLFAEVVSGLMVGAFIGAKFTRRLHPSILKTAFVAMPVFSGTLLLFGA